MELQCPDCKRKGDLTTFTSIKNAEVEALLDQIPEALRDAVVKYCSLFKPAKTALTAKKMALVISALLPDIQRQAINYKSTEFAAPHAAWEWALNRVLQFSAKGKVKPPLSHHNYLYVTITSYQSTSSAVITPVTAPAEPRPKKAKKVLKGTEGMSNDELNAYLATKRDSFESLSECFQRLLKQQEQQGETP